jgi:hypothetical protein
MLYDSYRGTAPRGKNVSHAERLQSRTIMSTSQASEGVERAAEQGVDADATSADAVGGEDIERLSLDVIFEILHVSRRRDVLTYLESNDGSASLDELAEFIAAKENGIEEWELSSSQRKRVYIGLYQCHLPKMDDAEIIEYNQPRGQVELKPAAAQLYPYLYLDPFEDEGEEEDANPVKRVLGLLGR